MGIFLWRGSWCCSSRGSVQEENRQRQKIRNGVKLEEEKGRVSEGGNQMWFREKILELERFGFESELYIC